MTRAKKAGLALFFILLVAYLGGCTTGRVPQVRGNIPQGTQVDDLDLSGLEPKEGQLKLQEAAKDKLAQTFHLVYNETEIPFSLKELGVDLDLPKTWERVQQHQGQVISSVLKVDKVKANQVLNQKLAEINRSAKDASYQIVENKFVIQPAEAGRVVANDAIIRQIDGHSWQQIPSRMSIPVEEVSPTVTTEAVKTLAFDSVIGEFSTKYAVQEESRSANLQAAAKALDKKIILPGETFSFNNSVGPRTVETGYKDAYIIVNNEYVQGTGGGVCQVSSTLYNVALLANLPIVERTPHTVAIAYVPLGQDATVNYPNIDFKFKNNTAGLIYIRTQTKPGLLTIQLWGKKGNKTVRLEHEVEKERDFQTERRADPTLPPGKTVQDQAGSKGYIVKSWRIIRDGQGQETKEYLGRDEYVPANKIIRYGIKG
ncbi:MAG: VanW family protein [Desulfitobacteriaceae bacterium]